MPISMLPVALKARVSLVFSFPAAIVLESKPACCGDREHGYTSRAHFHWNISDRWSHRQNHPLFGTEESKGACPHCPFGELGGGKEYYSVLPI